MAKKETPNAYQDFMQMFDPANLSKTFDPAAMMEKFGANFAGLNQQDTINKSKNQFEAMTKANQAAAQSYRELMEKQMKIFQDLTAEAAEKAKAGPATDATAAYQQAVNRALEIMTELSDATKKANEKAYDAVKGHVEEAMKDMKKS